MKLAIVLALILAVAVPGKSAIAAPSATGILGSWALDVSRMPEGGRPKSVTITFSEAGADRISTRVDILGGDGSASHATSLATLDGSVATVVASPEADKVSITTPQPNVLVMALSKGGTPQSTRVFAVAPDGKTLKETAVYFGDDGLPGMRVHYFTRLP